MEHRQNPPSQPVAEAQGFNEAGAASHEEHEAPRVTGELEAPRGTMALVIVYLSVIAVLWAYMYVILLRSEGVVGAMRGGM